MEGPLSDDNSDSNPDDAFSMVCGDLGLGEHSRSSSALRYELEVLSDSDLLMKNSNGSVKSRPAQCGKGLHGDVEQINCKGRSASVEEPNSPDKSIGKQKLSEAKSRSPKHRANSTASASSGQEDENHTRAEEHFPVYADVPYGTSLRQQKKLYEQNLGSIMKQHTNSFDESTTKTIDATQKMLSSDEIDRKLLSALEEVEELKQDLEVCKQRLDAKYNAITILKKQAEENNHEHVTNELKAKETSLKLAESGDGGSLVVAHWGLRMGETPRETLQRRYLRVCQENALLTAQLEARSEELRRATNHKSALRQERDELLALLDIKERNKYERSHSQLDEEDLSEYSTTELAVLGACRCRGPSETEPCGCAYAAANLMREVYKLREESKLMLQRREEAYMTVDAYRIAFEEQLQKSRTMTQQLASMATTSSRAVKAKAAVKWLLTVLADDEYPPAKSRDGGDTQLHTRASLEALTLPELVTLLTELLHEKKEALLHQKLAGQILSARLQETERKLQSLTEADGDVCHS